MRQARPIDPEWLTPEFNARFARKTRPEGDCIVWFTAQVGSYGRVRTPGGVRGAHRVALVAATGRDIGAGLVVDHLCRNTRCVNPFHLEAVPIEVNTSRGQSPVTRATRRINELGTCIRGHELTQPRITADGRKRCRQCDLEYRQLPETKARHAARARLARERARLARLDQDNN